MSLPFVNYPNNDILVLASKRQFSSLPGNNIAPQSSYLLTLVSSKFKKNKKKHFNTCSNKSQK